MISINLLPRSRRASQSGSNQTWLFVVIGLLAVEIVACLVWYSFKQEELDGWQAKNGQVEDQLRLSKEKVKNHGQVKKKLKMLRAREDAIAKLQSARKGPTAMLLELARMLTPGRGPSIDPQEFAQLSQDNPLTAHNKSWDSKRLWLTSFNEVERKVLLKGLARDGEDVSELAQRLNLSTYFYDVRLMPAKRKRERGESQIELLEFQLEAMVKY